MQWDQAAGRYRIGAVTEVPGRAGTRIYQSSLYLAMAETKIAKAQLAAAFQFQKF